MIRNDEAFHLFTAAAGSAKVPGDLAEFGVFEGASAKLICEAKGGRTLHLFDTFEGLPRPGPLDASHFAEGDFQCSVESVREYLSPYQKVEYHKGLFWESSRRISDKKFCFVNIDVDLYDSTLAAFEFFYPRMTPGGIMMSHDYTGEPAVRRAIDGFFATRPETVIELVGTQCLIVKIGAKDG
jgi:hypothetical protein